MKLSVIIPVFNEKNTIRKLVDKVKKVEIDKEIIIVDDRSVDGTRDILQKEYDDENNGIKVIYHEKNKGKGSSIRTGLKQVRGDIVVIQDADLEYNPEEYPKLIEPIVNGRSSVVYGSRFTNVHKWLFMWHWFGNKFLGRHYEIRYISHFLGIQTLNFITNILYKARVTDEATCYKAFRTEALREINLRCERFEFCPEVTAKIRKKGYQIYEVPITYHPRSKSAGKKLGWRDGISAIWTLVKYKFVD